MGGMGVSSAISGIAGTGPVAGAISGVAMSVISTEVSGGSLGRGNILFAAAQGAAAGAAAADNSENPVSEASEARQQGGGAMSEVLDPEAGGPDAIRDVMGRKTAQDMTFDGQKLQLYEPQLTSDGTMTRNRPLLAEYDAVSGRDGYQSSEFQSLANKGPIPAGDYLVR
jgi:hypothetical protein